MVHSHKLVQERRGQFHLSATVKQLILDYYMFSAWESRLKQQNQSNRHEAGISTGCTISVMLFALAMNMLLKLDEPQIHTFMNDLTVTIESLLTAKCILRGLEKLIRGTRMCFKPVVRFCFLIWEIQILTMSKKFKKRKKKACETCLTTASRIKRSLRTPAWSWRGRWKYINWISPLAKVKLWIYQ